MVWSHVPPPPKGRAGAIRTEDSAGVCGLRKSVRRFQEDICVCVCIYMNVYIYVTVPNATSKPDIGTHLFQSMLVIHLFKRNPHTLYQSVIFSSVSSAFSFLGTCVAFSLPSPSLRADNAELSRI